MGTINFNDSRQGNGQEPPLYTPYDGAAGPSTQQQQGSQAGARPPPNIGPDDVVIAVMGMTGVGKSTFISHFCPDAVAGDDLESCTINVGIHEAIIGNQKCYLIDTPGFDDTKRSDTDVLREVADWLSRSYQAQVQLAGIVYLHRILDNRMGGTATKNLRMFKSLCGDEGLSCVVLGTTMWGMVSPADGERRERSLATSRQFWAGMIEKGSKVMRQDNGAVSALKIIQYIMSQRRHITLKIQKEMASGKTLDETSAGQEVQAEMEALKKKYKEEMADLRFEMEEAARKQDRRAQEELAQVRAEMEEKLARDAEDRERMRVTMDQLQSQRNDELQRQRETALQKEMEFQKQMSEQQSRLEMAKMKNASDARLMEVQMQLALKDADNRRWEREDAERKRREAEGCLVM